MRRVHTPSHTPLASFAASFKTSAFIAPPPPPTPGNNISGSGPVICKKPSQKWYIYMRNQTLETELAYQSAKCNTLRQCGAITDLPHFIHNHRGVLFVAHKAITVRTSKISSCLSHISSCKIRSQQGFRGREEKITTTRKHLTISFSVRRNRYKTDRISSLYLKKNIHFGSN